MRWIWDFDMFTSRIGLADSEVVTIEGLEKKVRINALFQRAIMMGGGFDNRIDEAEEFATYVRDTKLRDQIIDGCKVARRALENTKEALAYATLDLQIWDKHGTAIVEVKAPNDRLRSTQLNTIRRARHRGERACVIYVDEA